MGGLLNQAALYDAVEQGRLIERDGAPVFLKKFRHSRAGKHPESMTTLEVARPAHVHVYRETLSLGSPEVSNLTMPFYYLRDMCRCPQCVDPHSKQRSFRTSDIPKDIYPRHVKWNGEQLEVKWFNDIPGFGKDHTSQWNSKYLQKPVIDTHDQTSKNMAPFRWSNSMMHKMQHWISYEDYMNDDVKFTAAMRSLSRLGLIFVKNIPESREMVEKIATRMGPLRNSFYGSTWDVKTVPQAKNVAYTNQFLGFHMDLLYMNEPPGYQLLHCLENSCEGGESLFADTFRVARIMEKEYPIEWRILTNRHLGYEYVHEDSIYHNTWPVFELDPRTRALRHVNYSPPFQSALPEWTGKGGKNLDGYALLKRALNRFAQFLEHRSSVFQLKLNPGECVIFANRRVVHARNKFNTASGSRWLAGAYVDEDAVLSRFAVSEKKNPIAWKAGDPVHDARKFKQEIEEESRAAVAEALASARKFESLDAQEDGRPVGVGEIEVESAVIEDESADIEAELIDELGQAKARD